MPKWSEGHFELRGMLVFDEPIPFTRESWRGRIRACRGVGATLSDDQIEAFDREHDALLRTITDGNFSVLHRIERTCCGRLPPGPAKTGMEPTPQNAPRLMPKPVGRTP